MANSSTADWRLRETINKRIERQIAANITPLTKYKVFYPFTGGGDIIDRRTGKVKQEATFVASFVSKKIGTKAAFIEQKTAEGKTRAQANAEYRQKKTQTVDNAKRFYSRRLHALAEMNITEYREAVGYQHARTDDVMQRFLYSISDFGKREEAERKLSRMSYAKKLDAIRQAKRRSAPAGHYTTSFFAMLGEYLGIDYPDPNTP